MSHITHPNESCHIWSSHVTYDRVISRTRMRHATHLKESLSHSDSVGEPRLHIRFIFEVIHIWISSHSYLNFKSFIFEFQVILTFGEPRLQIYEWVVSHTQISYTTQPQGRAVEPHLLIWMGHVTYVDASCHTQHMYRVAKFHGMPYLYLSFSAKEHCNWWLFCGIWPATYKACYGTSSPCTTQMSEITKLKCSVYEPRHCVCVRESVSVAALRNKTCVYVYGCGWVWENESSSLTMRML